MITSKFSVVADVIKVDEQYNSFIADPNDFYVVSFIGDTIFKIDGYIIEDLYGKLILCWGEGINTLYTILTPDKIIRINYKEYFLCKYLIENHDMIRGIGDIQTIQEFALL